MSRYVGEAAAEPAVEDPDYAAAVPYDNAAGYSEYYAEQGTDYQYSYGYQDSGEATSYGDPAQHVYINSNNTPRGKQASNSEDYGCHCGQGCPSGQGCRAWPIEEPPETSGGQPPKCPCGRGCKPGSGCWPDTTYKSCVCGKNCKAGKGCLRESQGSSHRSKHHAEDKREKTHSGHSKTDKKGRSRR